MNDGNNPSGQGSSENQGERASGPAGKTDVYSGIVAVKPGADLEMISWSFREGESSTTVTHVDREGLTWA